MSNIPTKYFYISGPETPLFFEKGLYSGLKSREGLPSLLPITLKANQEYTSTGFLDALPLQFLRKLNLREIYFRAQISGEALVSFYVLLQNKKIYHCKDFELTQGLNVLLLPSSLINEPNGRLIFFKIKALSDNIVLKKWAYSLAEVPKFLKNAKPIPIISRTLGDSTELVYQFYKLKEHYIQTQKEFTDHSFLPFPTLTIYESDKDSYLNSINLIKDLGIDFVKLKYNKWNLGGGGNMCLAVYEEFVTRSNRNQFIMIDSDTLIPFRTLYFSQVTAAFNEYQKKSITTVPTILYTKEPNIILESGALFGRGNWEIASSSMTQPCIAPLSHNQEIKNPNVQAAISEPICTDYPPFIFSIFNASNASEKRNFLPIPFFLRGDDIEMGIHLQSKKISCEVNGWLTVFQQPKHSLWHEFMAILHGTCLILAQSYNNKALDALTKFDGILEYFTKRLSLHSRALDLSGLEVYHDVLDRLTSLLEWSDDLAVESFHNPNFYLEKRSLNCNFSQSNFITIKVLQENGEVDKSKVAIFPFLYFESSLHKHLEQTKSLPEQLAMINYSNSTANIYRSKDIDEAQVQELYSYSLSKLNHLKNNSTELAKKCSILCSRKDIINNYLNQFSNKAIK